MANYAASYKVVKGNEGGYRNVSWDHGGETYKGIARNFWPNWEGWKIVDDYKKTKPLKTGDVIKNPQLDLMVQKFFEKHFWEKNNIHRIENDSIATLVFDFVINSGAGPRQVNGAVQKIDPAGLPNVVTIPTINKINLHPEESYNAIAAQRVKYITGLKSHLGKDFQAVLNRAKSFVGKYAATAAAGAGMLIGFFLFFTY